MGDIYGIAEHVLAMVKARGWVVRYESPEAEARGIMKEDATLFAIPLIVGFVLGTAQHAKELRRGFVRLREAQDCEVCGIGGATVCMRMEMDGKWQSPCLCDPCAVIVKHRAEELRAERDNHE